MRETVYGSFSRLIHMLTSRASFKTLFKLASLRFSNEGKLSSVRLKDVLNNLLDFRFGLISIQSKHRQAIAVDRSSKKILFRSVILPVFLECDAFGFLSKYLCLISSMSQNVDLIHN